MSTHGDHQVTVMVTDGSGNATTDDVSFTIDLTAPVVGIAGTPAGEATLPFLWDLGTWFVAHDDDGASGDVVHEVLRTRTNSAGPWCTVYDGSAYGNRNGLLSDEVVLVDASELCRISLDCGWASFNAPELSIEASDCGGNVGSAVTQAGSGFRLLSGRCDVSEPGGRARSREVSGPGRFSARSR